MARRRTYLNHLELAIVKHLYFVYEKVISMGKMLFLVPRMYTEAEFNSFTASLPDDFKEKTNEFWSYVNSRLTMFSGRIGKIYRDHVCKAGEEGLNQIRSIDSENYKAAKNLFENGANLIATEDPILVGESESWAKMLKSPHSDIIVLELLQQNLAERARHISNRINETLEDNETGVLFIKPDLQIEFSGDLRIIRTCPFDPSDYLRSWQVHIKLKHQKEE